MFNTFVKQTEVNSGGGVRISVYKQNLAPNGSLVSEEPHQITIGPFEDADAVIAMNNAALEAMGYPPIDPDELSLPMALRATAHAHALVQARMAVEAERIEQARADAEVLARKLAEQEAEQLRAAEAVAKARQQAIDDTVAALNADAAAREEAREATMDARIEAKVAEAVARLPKTDTLTKGK